MAHFARRASIYPPLNIALLAAISERHGHEVKIIDAEAHKISMPKLIDMAIADKPDIIALTGMSPFFHFTKDLAEGIKKKSNIPIALGGQHLTIMKEEVFLSCFDYGFIGEAEKSLPEFLTRMEKGKDLSDVKGMLFRKNGNIINTGPSDFDRNLDQLPFPARHLLDMKRYVLGTLRGRLNFTSIQTMRGCPWKCIFCASDELNTTNIAKRSPLSVIEEMKEVVEKYGIRHFMILDDVLTLDRKHIEEICDRIIEEGLNITFEGSTRANLLSEDLVVKMKKAGLIRLSFGLETVDSTLRETMNKKVPLRYYTQSNRLLNKYGIEVLNSVMLGLPGETRETARRTLSFLRKAKEVKQANLAIAIPYPGTKFHEMAKLGQMGVELVTDDFSEYRRYGSAVTVVNGLTPKDLIDLQNEGFVSIYSAPWRWVPMLKKHGIIGGLLMLLRVLRLVVQKSFFRKKE